MILRRLLTFFVLVLRLTDKTHTPITMYQSFTKLPTDFILVIIFPFNWSSASNTSLHNPHPIFMFLQFYCIFETHKNGAPNENERLKCVQQTAIHYVDGTQRQNKSLGMHVNWIKCTQAPYFHYNVSHLVCKNAPKFHCHLKNNNRLNFKKKKKLK